MESRGCPIVQRSRAVRAVTHTPTTRLSNRAVGQSCSVRREGAQSCNRAIVQSCTRAAFCQRRRESETKRRKATSRERLRTRDKRARWVKGHDDEISKSCFIIMFLVCFLNLCFIDILFQDLIKPKLLSPMVVLSRELDCYNFSYFRKHDFLLFILSPFYRRQVELMPNEYHHQMLLEKGFPLI